MGSSAIQELLKYTEKPDIISFPGELLSPDVFPIEEFNVALTVRRKNKERWHCRTAPRRVISRCVK
jgi:hypothetical protein